MSDGESVKPVNSDDWAKKLAEVGDFAAKHSRWPSTTAKPSNKEDAADCATAQAEKALGQWWSRQKYYYNRFVNGESAAGMTKEQADQISAVIDKFAAFERDGIWDARYQACKTKIEKDKELWSYRDTENEKIVRWWNQQKTFYRKYRKGIEMGGMTPERADLIEELMKALGEKTLAQQPMQSKTVDPGDISGSMLGGQGVSGGESL